MAHRDKLDRRRIYDPLAYHASAYASLIVRQRAHLDGLRESGEDCNEAEDRLVGLEQRLSLIRLHQSALEG
ncbi:hypothetical protein [Erythrobacter sp.]|uniref:hypothetical protein n=1 Tax=Erythrobacter sp. TaxID=1042 RepID=UPI001B09C3A3|nr:hypothetical protein [Erythrobacter sp.]MBO6527534.1 hypothetical protein [Erythrobacter sp.]MBO6530214.1 hypothetical protein [Erythrobacter sp.]